MLSRRARRVLLCAGMPALYIILALLYTWPMALWWQRAIPANSIGRLDGWQNTWHLWWTARALSHGDNPYTTTLIYYPDGVGMFWQTLNAPLGALMAPITLTLGNIAAYNIAIWLSFVLGGLCMFLLAHHLTRHRLAALVAGAAFVLAPFHYTRILDGSLEHASIQWLPLYLYLLIIASERGGWWRSAAAAGCFVCITLSSWYYGSYTALVSLVYTGLLLRQGWPPVLRAARVGGLICLVLVPLILLNRPDTSFSNLDYRQRLHSADLAGFLLPSPLHPLWGYPWGWLTSHGIGDWNVALGWSVLGLALIGLRAHWRTCWPWGLLLLLTLLLTLGPELQAGGHATGLPMPFELLNMLPGMAMGQRPVYWIAYSALFISLLAAYGTMALCQTPARRVLLAGCLAFGLFELHPGPLPADQYTLHPFFRTLAAEQPRAALLELPGFWWSSTAMRDQPHHHWPISGGYIARPGGYYPFMRQTPGLQVLWYEATWQEDILEPTEQAQMLTALDAAGFRYVVLRRTVAGPDRSERLQRRLEAVFQAQPPLVDDAELLVYRVPQRTGTAPILLSLGEGWHEVEYAADRRWRWIKDRAAIWITNPGPTPRVVALRLSLEAFGSESRPLHLALDDTDLGEITILSGTAHVYPLQILVPPGRHSLLLEGRTAGVDYDGRALSVVATHIQLVE